MRGECRREWRVVEEGKERRIVAWAERKTNHTDRQRRKLFESLLLILYLHLSFSTFLSLTSISSLSLSLSSSLSFRLFLSLFSPLFFSIAFLGQSRHASRVRGFNPRYPLHVFLLLLCAMSLRYVCVPRWLQTRSVDFIHVIIVIFLAALSSLNRAFCYRIGFNSIEST